MKCLLLGGAPGVGKTGAMIRLAKNLIDNGFKKIEGDDVPKFPVNGEFAEDFKCILKGKDRDGKEIKIIINSPSDTPKLIREFGYFYNSNGGEKEFDILISSVRDGEFFPRKDFFEIMELENTDNFILEIPLAKVTRRGGRDIAQNWYNDSIDNFVKHTLKNNPFNLDIE